MTKPKSATSPLDLILYGLDAEGRPRAAGFNAAQADLAKKAAVSLELQVVRIETADQIELAEQLPSSQILAPGRDAVPVVRKDLFDKLLAFLPAPDSGAANEAASPVEGDAATTAATEFPGIIYSAANANGDLGTSIFHVGNDVKEYIVSGLKRLDTLDQRHRP